MLVAPACCVTAPVSQSVCYTRSIDIEAAGLTCDKTSGGDTDSRKADPDPDGAKLAGTSDPLGEATKLLEKLKEHADSRCAQQYSSRQQSVLQHQCLRICLLSVQHVLLQLGVACSFEFRSGVLPLLQCRATCSAAGWRRSGGHSRCTCARVSCCWRCPP